MKNKRILAIVSVVAGLLLIPLIAMQFSDEVLWTTSDFIFAGVLFLGTGLGIEAAMRKTGDKAYRAGAAVALIATLMLIWMNLAVGIIGNENNPLNGLYFGVILIGIIGAVIARFRSRGMVTAMFVTAVAEGLVPVVALIIGRPSTASAEALMGIVGVFILSWFFAGLFAASAMLFRRANTAPPVETVVR